MVTENREDTGYALAHHVSGDEYVVTLCSLWDGEQCIGSRIIEVAGPVTRDEDLGTDGGPLEPSAALFDRVDELGRDWNDREPEDAEWLQAEEDAGRVTYPIGVRV